ncbi:nucleotide exchange factor GrpE [Rickettsiales endosymbiont of Peranema trichophorum]|uniref:nucleotide exchange factor GrpE n=1 Tax=Rickettsiales endosymbiont of Peranema trichophorum TaxID=2486577 RepID=UPI001022B427|nr:nucleotide exchange factor GrpE [Rickettsiales endosymbiont of Peranema trichophorum]RZI47788.1 nucleotide exchange factor GrpE [Rickettsiales endosymbiont of Peranema trichophorum]
MVDNYKHYENEQTVEDKDNLDILELVANETARVQGEVANVLIQNANKIGAHLKEMHGLFTHGNGANENLQQKVVQIEKDVKEMHELLIREQADKDGIRSRALQLEQDLKDVRESLLREKAENENVRKRAARELDEAKKYAVTNFARDLIDVLENMYRALESVRVEGTEAVPMLRAVVDGIELTKNTLTNIFQKYDISRIYPMHQLFDHNVHQAVLQVDTSEHPEGTVVQVIRAGYTIKDRLLSPALVAIAKRSSS